MRKAILGAAAELLLEHGLNAISMDAVARRAGASKATIYRWWPSKELLALDALFGEWEPGPPERHDTGSLAGDLLALIRPWVRQLARKPYGQVIAALIAKAQGDPEFAEEYRARFVEPRRDPARAIFARAIERGEIPPTPTSRSPSTSSTAPSTTGCSTATPRSPTGSHARSWTTSWQAPGRPALTSIPPRQ